MNAGGGRPGVRNENRVGAKQHRAQICRVLNRQLRIGGANGDRGLDPADVRDRGAGDEVFFRQIGDQRCREDDDVGRRAPAQFAGHAADRAELASDVETGLFLESRRETSDQALRRATAENVQTGHEAVSIAAIRRLRVIGRSRTRTPSASNTALAIAAVTGPCAASPAPTGSISGREITSTSTSGTSLKRRIGYSVHELLVMRVASKRTRSLNTQLVAWIAPPSI